MKRRALAAGIVIVLAAIVGMASRRRPDQVPTLRITPTTFTRRITVDGVLKAVNAARVNAPLTAPGPMKIAWIADDGTIVKKGEVIARFDPTDFEKERVAGNEDRTVANNRAGKAGSQASTTRRNLQRDAKQADHELATAKRFHFDDAEIFSRYERIQADVDANLASDKKEYAEDVLGVRENLARAELGLIAIEENKAALKIRNAEQGLQSIEIRAPNDGILVLEKNWRGESPRVGATAWPGMPLGEIPDLSQMKAEVFVLEADAAGLALDKRATVTLESAPSAKWFGKISQMDKLARPRIRNVPVQYFGVTLSLDKTDPGVMKPGARVRAILDIEDRRGAFVIPRQALFEKEGKKIVYRRRGEKFEPAGVEIAASTAGRLVVTKGIIAGDEIALVDPTGKNN